MKQTALILEGGGNRGIFTSGVLDFLMEKDITFSYVVGVSAGSCNAVDFLSHQPERTKNCMIPGHTCVLDRNKKSTNIAFVFLWLLCILFGVFI